MDLKEISALEHYVCSCGFECKAVTALDEHAKTCEPCRIEMERWRAECAQPGPFDELLAVAELMKRRALGEPHDS